MSGFASIGWSKDQGVFKLSVTKAGLAFLDSNMGAVSVEKAFGAYWVTSAADQVLMLRVHGTESLTDEQLADLDLSFPFSFMQHRALAEVKYFGGASVEVAFKPWVKPGAKKAKGQVVLEVVADKETPKVFQGYGTLDCDHAWSVLRESGVRIGPADVKSLTHKDGSWYGRLPDSLSFDWRDLPFNVTLDLLTPAGKLDKETPVFLAPGNEDCVVVAGKDASLPHVHDWLMVVREVQKDLGLEEEEEA